MKKIAVILVAGGRGSRAGEGLPKQYRYIAGQPLIRHTLLALQSSAPDCLIQPVIHPDDTQLFADSVPECAALLPPVNGGDTRQESVFNGLKSLASHNVSHVLVHDAARPFVSKTVIDNVLEGLKAEQDAVIPGCEIVDTLNRVHEGLVTDRVERKNLYSIQTPQGFSYENLLSAHKKQHGKNLTDDGAVMEAEGYSLHICKGNPQNFKITVDEDFKKAENILINKLADIRVGSGYDVHRFEKGEHITLCGHSFPSDISLKGHSDADVGLHAITDALLAAVAEGDIGHHFPPTEQKWKGVSSDVFLKHAASIIKEKGGMIANITVCLICERPKIGPHREEMRRAIAQTLSMDMSRISVQATTTEKLGFTGRQEGIAAQATATVRLPL